MNGHSSNAAGDTATRFDDAAAGAPYADPGAGDTDRLLIGAFAGTTVLVVEDDPSSREALELILEYYGARVLGAESVREALSLYDRATPSIVVSDIGLPDDDGYTLLRAIRAREFGRGRHTPAIAVTGLPRREAQERARSAGFDACLSKPVDIGVLLRLTHALTSRA